MFSSLSKTTYIETLFKELNFIEKVMSYYMFSEMKQENNSLTKCLIQHVCLFRLVANEIEPTIALIRDIDKVNIPSNQF